MDVLSWEIRHENRAHSNFFVAAKIGVPNGHGAA